MWIKRVKRFILFPMLSSKEIQDTLNKMILSASGWRGVFCPSGDEEGKNTEISPAHRVICGAAAHVFAEYLGKSPLVLLGRDTRPTGKAIIESMVPILLSLGCEVRDAGITAAPEIMAWARSVETGGRACGFIYVSASHNPIGHNGIKFGLTDGGVLAADEAVKLIARFREFIEAEEKRLLIERRGSRRGRGERGEYGFGV
jgi:phosphoglucomutase